MATATDTTTTKGFTHRCPLCGAENSLKTQLANLSGIECGECSEEITADDIRTMIAGWKRILAFLDSAPAIED